MSGVPHPPKALQAEALRRAADFNVSLLIDGILLQLICGDTLLSENVRTHIPKGIIIERRLLEGFVRILGGMGRSWFLVGVRLAVTRTERCGTRKSAHKMNKQLLDLQLTLLGFKQATDRLRQRMRSCQKGSG